MLHEDEILSDNSKANYCAQCEQCVKWGNKEDPFSNAHNKSSCDVYRHPIYKPMEVINNTGKCKFRETGYVQIRGRQQK